MKRLMGLFGLLVLSSQVQADILYCRFDSGWQPTHFLVWEVGSDSLTTYTGENQAETQYFQVVSEEGNVTSPYLGKDQEFTLLVNKDKAAIYIRRTDRATLFSQPGQIFPFEAYWGKIPGKLPVNFILDKMFQTKLSKKFGPRGVCWTDLIPAMDARAHEGGGGKKRHYNGDHCRPRESREHETKR